MVDTYRCKIVKEHGKYFTGIDYNGNRYKIKKMNTFTVKLGMIFIFMQILNMAFFQ